jgi:hypothetical protein
MTGPSWRRTVLAVVFFLATLLAAVPPSAAPAQAPAGQTVQAPPAMRTEARDDGSGKWGLLGLLGLAGLAGLPAPRPGAIGHGGRSARASIGGRSPPRFRQSRRLAP